MITLSAAISASKTGSSGTSMSPYSSRRFRLKSLLPGNFQLFTWQANYITVVNMIHPRKWGIAPSLKPQAPEIRFGDAYIGVPQGLLHRVDITCSLVRTHRKTVPQIMDGIPRFPVDLAHDVLEGFCNLLR